MTLTNPMKPTDYPSEFYRFTVRGAVPSKSNCYKVIIINGHPSLGKLPAVKAYESAFFMQCPLRDANIVRRFRLDIDVYYSNDRSDLDNALKVVLDCLQACKAIKNDRYCVEIHCRKLIDKVDPRVEFSIEELM